MKKRLLVTAIILAGVFIFNNASAIEFMPVGSDSISMGGAGVASAKGGYAPYYNPALLAGYKNNTDIVFAVSAGMRNINLADKIDKLADMKVEDSIDSLSNIDPTDLSKVEQYRSDIVNVGNFINELLTIDTKNGLQASPGFNLGCQIKQFGIGLYTVSDAVANAVIDQTRTELIIKTELAGGTIYPMYDPNNPNLVVNPDVGVDYYNAHSVEYALNNGDTYINLTGLAYVEIPVSGGYRFNTAIGNIDVGGSLKLMPGYTVDKDIKIDTSSSDVISDIRKDTKSSVSWGIDLGLLYSPKGLEKLSVGVVGKNLNTPQFKIASGGHLKAKPLARVGVAYDIIDDKLVAALDADLTKNETYLPDYYSQYIGGGLNFSPVDWFSVRAGLMQNIQESAEGLIITAGLGIGHRLFQVDLSALSSTKTAKVKG
jgi:hypothetical protein